MASEMEVEMEVGFEESSESDGDVAEEGEGEGQLEEAQGGDIRPYMYEPEAEQAEQRAAANDHDAEEPLGRFGNTEWYHPHLSL